VGRPPRASQPPTDRARYAAEHAVTETVSRPIADHDADGRHGECGQDRTVDSERVGDEVNQSDLDEHRDRPRADCEAVSVRKAVRTAREAAFEGGDSALNNAAIPSAASPTMLIPSRPAAAVTGVGSVSGASVEAPIATVPATTSPSRSPTIRVRLSALR